MDFVEEVKDISATAKQRNFQRTNPNTNTNTQKYNPQKIETDLLPVTRSISATAKQQNNNNDGLLLP